MLQIFINFHWTGFELLNSPFVATWSKRREPQKHEEDYGHLFQFMIIAQNIIGFNIEPFKFQAEAHTFYHSGLLPSQYIFSQAS